MNRRIQSTIAAAVMVSLVGTAQAGLITDRERIAAHLQRDEVAAELAKLGVTHEQVEARVAALSDEEAASLAGRIDEQPAGGAVPFLAFLGMALVMGPVIVVGAVVLGVVAIASAINKSGGGR